jgi:polyisoprenoid-binding protein YceI
MRHALPARGPLSSVRKTARTAAVVVALLLAFAAVSRAAVTTWEFDPVHSKPTFTIRHLFGMVPGHFNGFSGTVKLDEDKIVNSSVEVTIQTASISTDNEKRDQHLRSPDFFDAAKYPTITFRSTKVEPAKTKDVYEVTGDLTIRDVTRPVVVQVQVLGIGPDPFNPNGKRAGFIASTTINRLDYGVKWNKTLDNGGTLLGDEVKIEFPVEAATRSL